MATSTGCGSGIGIFASPIAHRPSALPRKTHVRHTAELHSSSGRRATFSSSSRCRRTRRRCPGSGVALAAADSPSDPVPWEKDWFSFPAVDEGPKSFWQQWRTKSAALKEKVSKWGLAAVLAYGLFDGITYTTFFVLAFLSYEKSTGQNPATNLKSLLGVVVLMWGGNNVTRPFRIAGAAALAPFIDKGLKKMQEVLKLPNQAFAFMICVATFACACFSVVGVLILSRLGG